MSREIRVHSIDAGGRLARKPERQVPDVQNNLAIDVGAPTLGAFGHSIASRLACLQSPEPL
jgi:hypothetical protein